MTQLDRYKFNFLIFRIHISGRVRRGLRTTEKTSARARHQRATARDVQNDGHQQGRPGRPERVPRNVPAVRADQGQLLQAGPEDVQQEYGVGAPAASDQASQRRPGQPAEAVDRRRRGGTAAGLRRCQWCRQRRRNDGDSRPPDERGTRHQGVKWRSSSAGDRPKRTRLHILRDIERERDKV